MPLTQKQIKEYVKNGYSRCPVCKSDLIEGGPIEVDSETAWQKVGCNDCNAVWNDIYTLSSVELLEEDEK